MTLTKTLYLQEIFPEIGGKDLTTAAGTLGSYVYAEYDFTNLYKDLLSWSKGEIEITLDGGIRSHHQLVAIVPREVSEDINLFSRYFMPVKYNDIFYMNPKAIFDLDTEIVFNFICRELLAKPELNNRIKKYDLQKAVGKSLKIGLHSGMACPVLHVKQGKLQAVAFGGGDGLLYSQIFNDSTFLGSIIASNQNSYSRSSRDSNVDFADTWIVFRQHEWQTHQLIITDENSVFKIYCDLSADPKHSYYTNNCKKLTTPNKVFDMSYILEGIFKPSGILNDGGYSRGFYNAKASKGTPIYINKDSILNESRYEITEDLCNILGEIFVLDDTNNFQISDAFFCDKDIFRQDKKTDANRYSKEEYGEFFVLRKNSSAMEQSENKTYSNFIRKALYPVENLVAAIAFYTDIKMSVGEKRFDTAFVQSAYVAGGSSNTITTSSHLVQNQLGDQIIDTAFIMAGVNKDIIQTWYPKFRKLAHQTAYKAGLFDRTFYQGYKREVEFKFFTSVLECLNTTSTRSFKSEKDFYAFDLTNVLYKDPARTQQYRVLSDFYVSNCTPCVPELDQLVANGSLDPHQVQLTWNQITQIRNASVDIATVFTLDLANVDLLKKVISFSRASEYKAFLSENSATLTTMINNLTGEHTDCLRANLLFALEALTRWTNVLAESEVKFIKDNPSLSE